MTQKIKSFPNKVQRLKPHAFIMFLQKFQVAAVWFIVPDCLESELTEIVMHGQTTN